MIVPGNISHILFASRAELSAKRSRELLELAFRRCEEWESSSGGTAAVLIKAQILAEIVNEENTSLLRANLWKKAFMLLDVAWEGRPESELSETYSSLSVDCFQDS